jgi:hypothetical protein
MDDAIERTERMRQRVRDQVLARLGWPWRFEEYPLAELAEPPNEAELEALMWELDLRHRETIQRPEEL